MKIRHPCDTLVLGKYKFKRVKRWHLHNLSERLRAVAQDSLQEIDEQLIHNSFLNCNTQTRRLHRLRWWQTQLTRLHDSGLINSREYVHWMEIAANRAFQKVTRHYWWRASKLKEPCACYKCVNIIDAAA